MTNLTKLKQSKNSKVLDQIKYYAMVGYSVESVDFNDDKIVFMRHTPTTKHPISLVQFKNNKLHMLSVDYNKPMSNITAMSNSIPAESIINSNAYDEYMKRISNESYTSLQVMKAELQKIQATEFDKKSQLIYGHFQGVSNQFKNKLLQHLESVKNVLLNAEICDENFLEDEINGLSNLQKESKKSLETISNK